MKKFLKILKWTGISLGGLLIVLIIIAILNPAPPKPLTATAATSAPVVTPAVTATPAPTAKPVATPTRAPATPTPRPQPSQPTQAEIDAANAATAQFKLDMLTSDIASDIRSEDANQARLTDELNQGKLQQAYSSAQSMSDKIDIGQKMYQTIADELENSPIKGKLKDIAINAKINLQGYQNGYKDYMKFLDSGKQSDLYNAQQNFAVAKSTMQDLETQLVQMGGHDQNQ